MQQRATLADAGCCEHLFNMSEEEFVRNQRELFYDKKYDAPINAAAEAAGEAEANLGASAAPAAGGEDAGGGLGDLRRSWW